MGQIQEAKPSVREASSTHNQTLGFPPGGGAECGGGSTFGGLGSGFGFRLSHPKRCCTTIRPCPCAPSNLLGARLHVGLAVPHHHKVVQTHYGPATLFQVCERVCALLLRDVSRGHGVEVGKRLLYHCCQSGSNGLEGCGLGCKHLRRCVSDS